MLRRSKVKKQEENIYNIHLWPVVRHVDRLFSTCSSSTVSLPPLWPMVECKCYLHSHKKLKCDCLCESCFYNQPASRLLLLLLLLVSHESASLLSFHPEQLFLHHRESHRRKTKATCCICSSSSSISRRLKFLARQEEKKGSTS